MLVAWLGPLLEKHHYPSLLFWSCRHFKQHNINLNTGVATGEGKGVFLLTDDENVC